MRAISRHSLRITTYLNSAANSDCAGICCMCPRSVIEMVWRGSSNKPTSSSWGSLSKCNGFSAAVQGVGGVGGATRVIRALIFEQMRRFGEIWRMLLCYCSTTDSPRNEDLIVSWDLTVSK